MKLCELLNYDNIMIQCHDNPDADALATAFALYLYLTEQGKQARIIYGGKNKIRKSNLVLMVQELQIPVQHVEKLEEPAELLVTVDCQYGESNVTRFEAYEVAVIDHHRVTGELPRLNEVRSNLGACSTLIWQMLKDEGYDVNIHKTLATALYYGLYTDTNTLTEIAHPLDMDLRDQAKFDAILITKFRNCNLSIEELETAGAALLRSDYNEDYRFAIVKAGVCDPNILGIISDLVLEVDVVDICLVFNVLPHGIKISVRSCVKEVKASELAQEICKGIGGGGGHYVKAGGTIKMELLTPVYEEFCKQHNLIPRLELDDEGKLRPTTSAIKAFLEKRMTDYFDSYQIIYAKDFDRNSKDVKEYYRKPIPMGYIMATQIFPVGTPITIRTLRGDMERRIEEDSVIMIGVKGEVYLRNKERLLNSYRLYDWKFQLADTEYEPTFKNNVDGTIYHSLQYAKVCVFNGEKRIKAQLLKQNVKIFNVQDDTQYVLGKEGDYLVIKNDNRSNFYTMDKKFFEQCYQEVNDAKQNTLKAVIFDLDGTLLDTLADLTDAVNEALQANDMPPRTSDEIRKFVGNGAGKLIERAIPGGTQNPLFEETLALYKTYYEFHCKDKTQPYDGTLQLLEVLKNRGLKLAIVSNKPDAAVKVLSKEYFKEFIDVAIGDMESMEKKPAPDGIWKALAELGVSREEAMYIGDSEVDIQTAENAGLRNVCVTWGFRDRELLEAHGGKEFIALPMELLYLI